jgi:putative membrane protein
MHCRVRLREIIVSSRCLRYNIRVVVNFTVRWLVSSLGLWLAASLLSNHISYGHSLGTILAAGFILAVINIILKPVFIFLSLPALILTLGLFMVIINGLMVYLASKLYTPLHITSFWAAVFAGMVIGLVNYIVTALL